MPKKIGKLVLYSTEELAQLLEIHANTVRAYIKDGKINGQKVGGQWYVSEDSLQQFFAKPYIEKKN